MWGRCLAVQNDIEGATAKYRTAIEINPEFGPAYFWWGFLLKNSNDCQKAIVKFQKAVEYKHELTLDSYGMWGPCLERLGRNKEALEKYQKIIEIAPNSIAANKSRNSIKELGLKKRTN